MNPAHLVSPLQQIEAFFSTVRAEIRAGAVVKSSVYSYNFEDDRSIPAGRMNWLGDDEAHSTRLSLLTASTATEGPIPDLDGYPSK